MKHNLISASGLDARGVGPRIMLRTFPFLLAAVISEFIPTSVTGLTFLQHPLIKTAGLIWLTVGLVFFIASLFQFSRNFPKGQLIRTGMYACSRNPIYASWILFILPSLWLIMNNWLFMLSAVVMCIATIILVREEEIQLLEVFGDEYEKYKVKVGCITRLL